MGTKIIDGNEGFSPEIVMKAWDAINKGGEGLVGKCLPEHRAYADKVISDVGCRLVGSPDGDFMWGGMPFKVDPSLPAGEVHFIQGDQVVGKIINVGS